MAKAKTNAKWDHHYSGDNSTGFWKRVNKLDGEEHAVLYALGCVLQNLEETVLRQLLGAESTTIAKSMTKAKNTYPRR
jgi:hypothetical protein